MSEIEYQLQSVHDAVWSDDVSELTEAISTLLENEDFCPQGGLLGFPLWVPYQVDPEDPLNDVLECLEGGDDTVALACNDLGLGLSIKTVLHDPMGADYWQTAWEGGRLLIDSAIILDGDLYPTNGLLEHFLDNDAQQDIVTQLVHPYDGSPCHRCSRYGERSKAIAWVRPLEGGQAGYTLEWWSAFTEELESEWVYITLIAAFGPAGDRSNWEAYRAEEWRGEDD
ncbi:hypothetical protein L218DRAFT_1006983 [Marasmius fiardii PR-910]|nr:hypothetical protein L218DRAFT_1006983 [Marasmius fiardii PR-910]